MVYGDVCTYLHITCRKGGRERIAASLGSLRPSLENAGKLADHEF